jgi:AcrR family transcriptional regulator
MCPATRANVASLRRAEIVEAATAVIVGRGIQHLSLSAIEKKAGMARGQLTYYFKTKEEILLAVFDRVLQQMYERMERTAAQTGCAGCLDSGWSWVRKLLTVLLTQPPPSPEFGCLQYTFLAQVGHREDFRRRLATLYEQWRSDMAQGLAGDLAAGRATRPVPPRAMATLVQALLHGLIAQAVADPKAFDRQEMLHLCLDMLGTYLGVPRAPSGRRKDGARKKPAPRSNNGAQGLRPVAKR